MNRLYAASENYVPVSVSFPTLKPHIDFVRVGTSVYFKSVTGLHGGYEIRDYVRVPINTTKSALLELRPSAKELPWPLFIGRFETSTTTFDVIFEDSPSLGDSAWSSEEWHEYTKGNYGFWSGWTYDLHSASLACLTMDLVMQLPRFDRMPSLIARHITANMDVLNNPRGIIHGNWTSSWTGGVPPTAWRRVHSVVAERHRTGKPSRYGQCWVFAEVLTAMFRFLGLPARTVYAKNAHVDVGLDRGFDIFDFPTVTTPIAGGDGGGYFVTKSDEAEGPSAIRFRVSEAVAGRSEVGIPLAEGQFTNTELPDDIIIVDKNDLVDLMTLTPCDYVPDACAESIGLVEEKGGVVGFEADPLLPEEKVCLAGLVARGDRMWNFHVWTEVWLHRLIQHTDGRITTDGMSGWHVCDPSPINEVKSTDGSDKHCYGPCPVTAIKKGTPVPHDFNYIFSGVNSLVRRWASFHTPEFAVTYPHTIDYEMLKVPSTHPRAVTLMTRHPSSVKDIVQKELLTDTYRSTDYGEAFEAYHHDFPVIIYKRGTFDDLMARNNPHPDGQYLFQVTFLHGLTVVGCHRKIYTNLNKIRIPPTPAGITSISILTVDLMKRTFWPQIV